MYILYTGSYPDCLRYLLTALPSAYTVYLLLHCVLLTSYASDIGTCKALGLLDLVDKGGSADRTCWIYGLGAVMDSRSGGLVDLTGMASSRGTYQWACGGSAGPAQWWA